MIDMGLHDLGIVRSRLWQIATIISMCWGSVSALSGTSATPPPSSPKYPATMPAEIRGVEKFARVSEGLYRGAQPTAEGFAQLKRMGIKTVVSLRSFHTDTRLLQGSGLAYIRIGCNAWSPQDQDVITFLKIVRDPRNQPVFVHCAQGVDRTGMMVAAYRIAEQGWSTQDAEKELQDFGFHPIWADIRRHVERFDIDLLRGGLQNATAMSIGRSN
jgi:tyrosine-protein phosphatase SIW14